MRFSKRTYAIVVVIAMVVIAIAGYVYMKRGKNNHPSFYFS